MASLEVPCLKMFRQGSFLFLPNRAFDWLLWLLILYIYGIPVCTNVCVCIYVCFLCFFLGSFSSLLLVYLFSFYPFLFHHYPLEAYYFLRRDRKGGDLGGERRVIGGGKA